MAACDLIRLENRDGDGACMHPPPLLRRRHALDPVAAGFDRERLAPPALDQQVDLQMAVASAGPAFPRPAGLSTPPQAKRLEGACKLVDEQLRVGAAFRGTDFDNAFHDMLSFGLMVRCFDLVTREYHGYDRFRDRPIGLLAMGTPLHRDR